ncbi:MAG TPA: ATP-binding protein [Flavobacteriaceae bacterium]|nr:ATP-binding protein [Flavobacteriaceae bacterium]
MTAKPQLFVRFEKLLEKIVGNKNLTPIDKLEKKYMLTQGVVAISSLVVLLIAGWIISAKLIVEFCLVYIPIMVIGMFGFYVAKSTSVIILLYKMVMILISSIYVIRMGGLFTSGGLFLMAILAVTSTVVLRNFRKIYFVVTLFVVCMIILTFFQPMFPTDNILSPKQNAIIFAMVVTTVTGWILFFSFYAVSLFEQMEHRETQRQKELNDVKTRLYTNITHEFRTPLTVILGLADAVKRNGNGSGKLYAKADTIIKNGKRLLQLVDQMLDLSKLESGNLTVNKIHGNIIPFLRYIFQLQESYAEEKNIQLSFHAESQSYELDFDPEKTTAIVSNLLSNAIKFTPVGGKVEMNVYTSDEDIYIVIKDTGIGIPAENLEKIFERFYQADDKNTRKAGGAGIGLALTRELVNLLDGSIDVKSIPGTETIFTVKLPATSLLKSTKKEFLYSDTYEINGKNGDTYEDFDINIGEKQQLLIVEDNQDVISYLRSCYQLDYDIQIATDGKEGYEVALNIIPDIIISDVMMPEMDGFELCGKLKNDYRTSHIPIILLTAKADLPSRIEGLEQGADAYIVKPFNQQELLVRMRKLLELRKKLFSRYSNGNGLEYSPNPLIQKEDQFFKKLNDSIQKNLNDENFDIQVLCNEMAMSKSQLYRKFKALINMSAAKYIRKLRLKKAGQLLRNTSMNITEVSEEVGIKTLSTFSELFKTEFGQSPSEYIKNLESSKSLT